MEKRSFFTLPNGERAHLFTVGDPAGFRAEISEWGGTVAALYVPDREGKLRNVLLSHRDPAAYWENPGFLGALVGRVPNRIGGGRFLWDGVTYQSVLNDRGHSTLHGGFSFGRRMWRVADHTRERLVLTLTSPDGDAGFPGELSVEAEYRIGGDSCLELTVRAASTAPAPADFTSHMYFNLAGEDTGSCADHVIRIFAERRTAVDDFLVPTGETPSVAGTPWDLRSGRTFAEIRQDFPNGLDDNFILSDEFILWKKAAQVRCPASGITLDVETFSPGIQFYMAGHMDGVAPGRSRRYPKGAGFCLETQGWPDSLNHPGFPSIRLEPGHPRLWRTLYRFSREK